jgi:hypothetical protein
MSPIGGQSATTKEMKMSDVTVTVIETKSEYDLHCHYSGQTQRQGCYIELDCPNKTLSAHYNSEIGNAIPFSVYHGHDQWFGINLMRGSTADALMEEILPLAQRVVDGYDSVWNGSNHIAKFTDDAQNAIDEIEAICDSAEGDLEVWDAGDWLGEVTHQTDTAVEIEGVGTITAQTTDDELEEMERKIDAMAEDEGVFLNAVDRLLDEYRSECVDEDNE